MSTEEEFSKWLRRKDKTFEENLKFAIKAWQSVEFTLTTKYELILQWLSEQTTLKEEEIVEEDFKELLKLRAQPGLITQKVKRDYVEWLLKIAKASEDCSRKWCELVQLLVEYELLQDLYRGDYELHCQVYGVIFSRYKKYLQGIEENSKPFLNTYESEYFASILKSLKETIKRCADVLLYEKSFTSLCLPHLVEALLLFRSYKVDFFDELLEMERLICMDIKEGALIKRIMDMPLHVRLLALECSIVNCRGIETYLKQLLHNVFENFLKKSSTDLDPSLSLTVAAYAMEMLGRHDVGLNIKMHEEQTALQFLGKYIYKSVKGTKDSHLKEVLMLLCAALHLNPLILEQHVFEITAWMILAPKSGEKEEQQLFEEYLVLLMDMFRRLSRAEKFVTNLLKTLNENVKNAEFNDNKKRKCKLDASETPLKKKRKLNDDVLQESLEEGPPTKYLNILFQDFFKPILTKQSVNDKSSLSASTSFAKLQNFWPSNPVGLAFSRIITGLVSKPSLTIWKSLLFGLKELIESFNDGTELNEKSLFQLDFHTALLTQYFVGCKLAEQSDKFLQELQSQREFTAKILQQFGKFLLKREHQPRTMTAFLELSYYSSCFELLLIFYRPDGCEHETLQPAKALEKLHSFLSLEEWTLIQQRVLNFGKSSCKHLLQRLELQKSQAYLLLLSTTTSQKEISLKTSDAETLNALLKTPQAKWYLQKLPRLEKETIAAYITAHPDFLSLAFNDLELLEFVSLALYEDLCKSFNSKHSLLKSLSCDFDNVRQCIEITACELLIKQLMVHIVLRSEDENKVKKLDGGLIKTSLDLLSQIPLGQLRRQRKTIVFALHLSLYRDLKAAQEEELALQALDIMKEFSKWLRRKDKTFEENLKFAIKAWQSVEFTLTTKYELILQWLSEQTTLKEEEIVEEDFKELLKLRAQPGLITQKVKRDYVEWLLKIAKASEDCSRKWCELVQLLVEYELLQDLYRGDYELHCQVYGVIFSRYKKYLQGIEENSKPFLNTYESEYFASILKSLKETIKRCADVLLYEKSFTSLCLPHLVEALLLFRSYKVDFFDELLEMERLICMDIKEGALIKRIMDMPLHVRLLALECSIVNCRGIETYLKQLLHNVFENFLKKSSTDLDPSLSLTVAAYAMEMLGRHDVGLNIKMHEEQTALQFLGKYIYKSVKGTKDSHLKEVLMLLCAALHLNPLILEQHVFEITAWMILAPKSGEKEEQQLFEEYLVLLMDMFRRLSRAEKFVTNLLKTLNENVKNAEFNDNKKRKCKLDASETPLKKKRKLNDDVLQESLEEGPPTKYLNILFQDFFKPILTKQSVNDKSSLSASTSFAKLQNFWPSNPVGLAFSRIITGLVSKPSLTIWKSLLFGLKELIESFNDGTELNEKSLFQLDFHTALLTQYFVGCKLAEQSDKFLQELQSQREFTAEILQQFGKFLLKREHQPRTMTAFLELSYYSSCFELLLIFYRPDGCEHETLQPAKALEKLHSFLSLEEWTLIQQRVLNFGKSSCKHLLQRLELQKSQAYLLLLSTTTSQKEISLKTSDAETLNALLKTPQAKWYLQKLPRLEKETIAAYLIAHPDFLSLAFNDLELLEFVSLALYEDLCKSFNSKHSLLKSLSCDFDNVRQCIEITACELLIKQLMVHIVLRSEDENKVKKLDGGLIKTSLDLLSQIPLGQLRRQRKTIVFALHLSLYRDLKAAQEEELALQALDIMKDLLHFGQQVLIFKYLPTSSLLKLLPAESCWELYEFLFSTVKNEEKGTEQFLQSLASILEESQAAQSINEEQRKLLLAAIETLSTLNGPCAKRMRKHLEVFLQLFSEYLKNHFTLSSDGTSKKDKKFVQKTLAGFAPYASAILTKASKGKEKKAEETTKEEEGPLNQEVNEDFRRISKIYIGHSMDYRNPHAIRLMQVALNHRDLLHLDQDEIEFVLTNYWSQIQEDLKQPQCLNKAEQKLDNKTIESAVKMIIGNKTNEDLLLTLKTIATNVEEANFSNILRLLTLIAKCPFSTIKGAIFNEQYKQITFNITLRLCKDEQQQFKDNDLIINLLNCHQAIIDNKMVPMSTDTMDSILSFLMDINIKKFSLCDTNLKLFNSLHMAMTDVCSALIKQRHILLMDRVPQYMHIFKDLLQSIVWYKSDRQKDTALPTTEIDDLAELTLKLESLMHLIAQHSVGFKRVAPFVLTFIINLMVSNKRPTTLYNKIKTHIENICYELVGICDHRVGRFILRCSNEAGRQLYELLVKDYQKYHKFKGKV